MKKVKVYFVTYNSPKYLTETLHSFFSASNLDKIELETYIINNHSNFELNEEHQEKIKHVYHNELRPDFSTGHLSRNWNQAIINGFKNLNEPDCDIVITCQDDTIWTNDWVDILLETSERYGFYTCNNGDMLCYYTPEAVKHIGLWDERFCNIQFQEADYFYRAKLYYSEHSSINDSHHGRKHNQTKVMATNPHSGEMLDRASVSNEYHNHSKNLLFVKWGEQSISWGDNPLSNTHARIPSFFFYPYFEKDMYSAKDKGYVIL
jgi:glycosyltransferase involved in cell wall biosynthesis